MYCQQRLKVQLKNFDSTLIFAVRVGSTFGVKGFLHATSLFKDHKLSPEELLNESGEPSEIEDLKYGKKDGEIFVRFKNIFTPECAKKFCGIKLFVSRAILGSLTKNEFYAADLVGCSVIGFKDERIGTISGAHNFGSCDLISIKTKLGERFFEFSESNFPNIDIEKHVVQMCCEWKS